MAYSQNFYVSLFGYEYLIINVDFQTLRQAFKAEYPVSEPPSQTDLLVFEFRRIFQNNPVTAPLAESLPVSSTLKIINPVAGSEAVAGIPIEIFAISTLPRTVGKVEFYVGATKIGEDRNLPYSVTFTPTTLGALALRAIAISPDGQTQVASEIINVTVVASPTPITPNIPPVVTLVNPGTVTAGQATTLSATASDSDGIAKVEFYQGSIKLGEDSTSPYTQSWNPTAGSYVLTAIAFDALGAVTTSAAINVTVAAPTNPTPVVSIANTTRPAGLINEILAVNATASITGDILASVLFRADGVAIGSADAASPYSVNYTPTTKGVKQISAVATGALSGTATSANYPVRIYDTKAIGGGASAAGASLGAVSGDFILFDNNQSAGGNAASMNVFVGGVQVGVFNYGDTAYNGAPFVYFNSGNNTLYTMMTNGNPAIVQGTVNF